MLRLYWSGVLVRSFAVEPWAGFGHQGLKCEIWGLGLGFWDCGLGSFEGSVQPGFGEHAEDAESEREIWVYYLVTTVKGSGMKLKGLGSRV